MNNKTAIEQLAIVLQSNIRCSASNVIMGEKLIEKLVNDLIIGLEINQELNVNCLDSKQPTRIKLKTVYKKYLIVRRIV